MTSTVVAPSDHGDLVPHGDHSADTNTGVSNTKLGIWMFSWIFVVDSVHCCENN